MVSSSGLRIFLFSSLFCVALFCAPADAIRALWVSDIHYNSRYHSSAPITQGCMANTSSRMNVYSTSAPFGRYGCDPPSTLVTSLKSAVSQYAPEVDFLFMTGDFASHGSSGLPLTESEILYTSTVLGTLYPQSPLRYYVLGNDDFYPDYFFNVSDTHLSLLQREWTPYVPALRDGQPGADTFRKCGFYSDTPKSYRSLRIIVLNTVLYNPMHEPQASGADPCGQFSWLKSEFSLARASQERVIVLHHVPTGGNFYDSKTLWISPYDSIFDQIISDNSDLIAFILTGHLHRDDFRLISQQKEVVAFQLIGAAVTPGFGNNPSFRVLDLESESYLISDIHTYYADLAYSNQIGKLSWELEYRYRDAYSIVHPSLHPTAMQELFEQLRSNSAIFSRWNMYRKVLYSPSRDGNLCATGSDTQASYEQCLQSIQRIAEHEKMSIRHD